MRFQAAAPVSTPTDSPGTEANRSRFLRSKAFFFFVAVWALSMAALFVGDRNAAFLALSSLGYAALLAGIVHFLIPKNTDRDDAFDATQPRKSLAVRSAWVAFCVAFTLLVGVAGGGISGGIRVPVLTRMLVVMYQIRIPLHDSVEPYFNFLYLALIPGIVLLLLGLKPAALGLKTSARGTGRALLACMIVPVLICGFSLISGKITLLGLLFLAIHNLFSNGFSEEFSMRGIVMSHLGAYVTLEWALVFQSIVFALMHTGGTVAEEHWKPVLILANVLALNMPIALSLGFMAVRSRSILLPSAVHVSLDTMGRLVGAM